MGGWGPRSKIVKAWSQLFKIVKTLCFIMLSSFLTRLLRKYWRERQISFSSTQTNHETRLCGSMVRGGGQPRNVISKLAQREVCVKEKTLLRGVPTGVQVTPVSSSLKSMRWFLYRSKSTVLNTQKKQND